MTDSFEKTIFDWLDLSEQERAQIRFTVKAETAQSLRRLPMMVAAKVAVEILAERFGTAKPKTAMSAVGTLCSDLAGETLVALQNAPLLTEPSYD